MADFRIEGIDHVNITTPEELEAEVIAFYVDALGLKRLVKPPQGTSPGGAWFRAGAQELHLSVDPHNPPQQAHFGIAVDKFEAAVERLRSSGVHIEQAKEIPGRRRFYTRDPAGNRIEVAAFAADPETLEEHEPVTGTGLGGDRAG